MRVYVVSAQACLVALSLVLLAPADRAIAEPSPDQIAAIKANCRSDFMANCSGVKRGGPEAVQCLKSNMAKLSSGCQQAVKAVSAAPPKAPVDTQAAAKPESAPAPASASTEAAATPSAAAAPAQAPEPAKVESASTPQDVTSAPPAAPKLAPEPKPKTAATKPAEPGKSATMAPANAAKTVAPAGKAPDAPQSAAAPADEVPAIIGFIPPRKKLMIFHNCRDDLEAHCADVSYGEGRQLQCLLSNKASLSSDCQGALAKLAR